jgi:hypothetical protein
MLYYIYIYWKERTGVRWIVRLASSVENYSWRWCTGTWWNYCGRSWSYLISKAYQQDGVKTRTFLVWIRSEKFFVVKICLLTYNYCKCITKWQKRAVLFRPCSYSWGVPNSYIHIGKTEPVSSSGTRVSFFSGEALWKDSPQSLCRQRYLECTYVYIYIPLKFISIYCPSL